MEELRKYEFIDAINALPFVQAVWIYGSRARGDYDERSDIDMAVVCKEGTNQSDWAEVEKIVEHKDTLLQVDLVRFDSLSEGKFKERIMQEKKVW